MKTRLQLLSAVCLHLALGTFTTIACAAEVVGPKLGIQTWTLRRMSFDQVVEFADRNDIQYLQLLKDHLDPNAPVKETRRKLEILKKHGLIPYTFGVASTSSNPKENRNLFEFAKLIGAKMIVVEPALADWDGLEKLVKEYDVRLAIHNHGRNSRYGDPKVVKEVLANRDRRIGVCLDVGWITAAGFDAAQVFRNYGNRVFDIHFKDKKLPTIAGNDAVDTLAGEGDANYAGLFAEIRKSGWSGVMAIETDSDQFANSPQTLVTAAMKLFSQVQENWLQLFNGRDLDGWIPKITRHEVGENFANTFRVEEGLLKVRYDGYERFDGQFGHLFYDKPYSYYRLKLQYRFVDGNAPGTGGPRAHPNSGVMVHSQAPQSILRDQDFPISIEAQFLAGLGDGSPMTTMNVCTPATEIVYRDTIYPKHCLSSSSPTFERNQWVNVEMVVLGDSLITHKVDGKVVLEYTLPQIGGGVVTNYDSTNKPEGKLLSDGYISLQSESFPIDFRNIELLDLEGCMNPKAANFRSYFVRSKPDNCEFR